jgi:hypothetical protein
MGFSRDGEAVFVLGPLSTALPAMDKMCRNGETERGRKIKPVTKIQGADGLQSSVRSKTRGRTKARRGVA